MTLSLEELMTRVRALTLTDAAVADYIATEGSDTREQLAEDFPDRTELTAAVAPLQPGVAPFQPSVRPAWSTTARPFDPTLGVFNLRPDNMRRWRRARARQAAGLGQAHVSAGIDSITHGAGATGASNPKHTNSWPGRLRRMFDAKYGAAGSGIVPLRSTMTVANQAWDPRVVLTGTIEDTSAGINNLASKRWLAASDANYLTFTATCTEFWIYGLGAGSRPRVQIDGGTVQTISGQVGMDPSLTDWDPEAGYQGNVTDGFGQIVTKVTAGASGSHALKLMAPSNGTSYVQVTALEARIAGTAGIRVSNLGHNGVDTSHSTLDDATYGVRGMAQYFDMVKADLAVLLVGMNDFQVHRTTAAFKANLTTMIQRQRSSATYRANGDVLLVACAQPNYASPIPLDGIQTPALTAYYTAMYEVAHEQDVPLLDLAHRWTDFGVSNGLGFFADALHPGDSGLEDIATGIYNVLMAV
ncbi:mycolate esterase [Rhodococcus phage Mbo2]|uniref:Mycolate esterase n=1 Tax=Rhodococcus phage Mbo2 TaxID=2936911 RepID=A0A9E7IGK4_9CAUD|nr:mycolate esterase [Rhodococcus phage Mbo2]